MKNMEKDHGKRYEYYTYCDISDAETGTLLDLEILQIRVVMKR